MQSKYSGKKFKFGNLSLSLPNDFDPNKFKDLEKIFEKLSGSTYNYNRIEKILDEIEKIALFANYEFINAEIEEEISDENINFIFNIKESKKVYVDKINILGNHITNEEFIRNQLIVDEGDPFNKILHTKSVNNLKSTGIFKSVNSEIIATDNNDKNIINLDSTWVIQRYLSGQIQVAGHTAPTLNVNSNGTLKVTDFYVGRSWNSHARDASAIFNINSGGSVTVDQWFTVGLVAGSSQNNTNGATGVININGGSLTVLFVTVKLPPLMLITPVAPFALF